jgi:putative ABC transport system permease protein
MWNPVITGIFNFDYPRYDEQVILTDFQRLQRLLTLDEGTQQLVIFIDNENKSSIITAELQNLLGEDSVVSDWSDNYWIAVQKMNDVAFFIAYIVFLIVASFMIINTVTMIIHERIKEIGMMGSLGMTRFEIVKVFFYESFFLAAIGAFCGMILGAILTGILSMFPLRLADLYGNSLNNAPVSGTVFFLFSFKRIIQAWFIGVIVASFLYYYDFVIGGH